VTLERGTGTPDASGRYLAYMTNGAPVVAYWSQNEARWSFLSRPIGVAVYFTPALPEKA